MGTVFSLLPKMTPYITYWSENAQKAALCEALRDFCYQSESLVQDLDSITTVADQDSYSMTIPSYRILHRVKKVLQDDYEVPYTDWSVTESDELVFETAPTEAGLTVVVTAVLLPTTDDIDDYFLSRWGNALRDGALFFLMSTPYSPGKVNGYSRDFYYTAWMRHIGNARSLTWTARQGEPLRAEPRNFA